LEPVSWPGPIPRAVRYLPHTYLAGQVSCFSGTDSGQCSSDMNILQDDTGTVLVSSHIREVLIGKIRYLFILPSKFSCLFGFFIFSMFQYHERNFTFVAAFYVKARRYGTLLVIDRNQKLAVHRSVAFCPPRELS
jgi:hypothetical protein